MSRLSADSWLPLANFLQTCCPWSWPSMWPPEDHSDNERKYGHERRKAGGSGLPLQVPPPAPRLPDRRPAPLCRQSSMFPVSLRMPLEMAPFGGWGALAAFLSLLCCRGEPGGPDWVRASQRLGRLFPWCRVEKGALVPKSLRLRAQRLPTMGAGCYASLVSP